MKFCSECAHPVLLQIPPGEDRLRYICASCGKIHYQNPKIVTGSIPVWKQDGELRVLLCKRAIAPRYGYWTLPAGFMENNETTHAGACRETLEEANARIELHELFSLINVSQVHQVHLFYRATLLDLNFSPGVESLEVNLFTETEIPWDDIAFSTIELTLRAFFSTVKQIEQGCFSLYTYDVCKPTPNANKLRESQ